MLAGLENNSAGQRVQCAEMLSLSSEMNRFVVPASSPSTPFDFPATPWVHLHATNPIALPVATVKARTRTTKGAGSRSTGLTMAFTLALAARITGAS